MRDFDHYWQEGFPQVEGWVHGGLGRYVGLLGHVLRDRGVRGNIAEIGVYHGKFLIALAHLLEPGGKVTGFDVFDDQSRNIDGAGEGNLATVQAHVAKYGPAGVDFRWVKADSSALTPTEKMDVARERGPMKVFSVDGCHTREHTITDLYTAQDFLCPGGVLILDDMFQPHWPGVTEAMQEFTRSGTSRLRPFFYAHHKIFLTGFGWHAEYLHAFAEFCGGMPEFRIAEMYGSRVATVYP